MIIRLTRQIAVFLCCWAVSSPIFSQNFALKKGFYLDAQDNKVEGYFDFDKISENVLKFSEKPEGQKLERLLPEMVKKIELSDGLVLPKQKIERSGVVEHLFLEPLIAGKISLFRAYSKLDDVLFFISSLDKPEVRRISRTDPKSFFFAYIEGCETVKKQLGNVYHDRASLLRVVRQFGTCYKTDNTEGALKNALTDPENLTNSTIEIAPNLGISYFEVDDNTRLTGFHAGVQARLNLRKNLFFSIGLRYNRSIFNGIGSDAILLSNQYAGYIFERKPTLILNNLELPLSLGFKITAVKKITPIITLGIVAFRELSVNLKDNDYKFSYYEPYKGNESLPTNIFTENIPKIPFLVDDNISTSNSITIGVTGGIGVRKVLNQKWAIEGMFSYFFRPSSGLVARSSVEASNFKRFDFTLSSFYRF